MIGKGRELADRLGAPLTVLVMGRGMDARCRELLEHPVDAVLQVEDAALAEYASEPYARVMTDLIEKRKPEIILAGATAIGRSFLARVAVAAGTGLTADCTDLAIGEGGVLVQTCPGFGGNIFADIVCSGHRPQMATVRPKAMPAAERGGGRGGRLEKLSVDASLLRSRTRRLEFLPEESDMAGITEADVIVAGGRGMRGPEGFALLEKLAKLLGGTVGATRGPVDEGWIPYSRQIGQTGKTVRPKLFIACGISGAVHHLVGMNSSDCIIAVNRDREAPIFSVATYGIVGDAFEVVPAMIRELERVR